MDTKLTLRIESGLAQTAQNYAKKKGYKKQHTLIFVHNTTKKSLNDSAKG